MGADSAAPAAGKTAAWETLDKPSEVLQCAPMVGAHRRTLARFARSVWPVGDDRNALLSMAQEWNALQDVQGASRTSRGTRVAGLGDAPHRQYRDPRPPACSWWEKRAPRALGRSRGGFGTKIHLRTDRKGNPITFTLTSGEKHDAAQLVNCH